MDTSRITLRLDEVPLWRLLVALDDAERVAGADSSTAKTLAREIQRRLAGESNNCVNARKTGGVLREGRA